MHELLGTGLPVLPIPVEVLPMLEDAASMGLSITHRIESKPSRPLNQRLGSRLVQLVAQSLLARMLFSSNGPECCGLLYHSTVFLVKLESLLALQQQGDAERLQAFCLFERCSSQNKQGVKEVNLLGQHV